MVEDKLDTLLQMRASLGRWQKDGVYTILAERKNPPVNDSRIFLIKENRGAYTKDFEYNVGFSDAEAKIKAMQQTGYKLVAPLYPELQEHFRNGKPITAADEFSDAMEKIESADNDLNGLDFLLANWN